MIGQEEAITNLSKAIIRSFAGINSPDRPRGVFLFLGESGVGKTALAKALAIQLFQTEDALIRYDMSKLIGSAPGYVGYDDQNSALERLRKHPYSVVLLDEIEKAHPDVLSLFLQIFDTGYLTDASGRKISFRNAYIIMTSNIDKDKIRSQGSLGFMSDEASGDLRERLKGQFKAEFINRIDEILLFSPLTISALKEIAELKILDLSRRILSNGIKLEIDSNVYDLLAKKAIKSKGFGARPINRLIQSELENKIAEMMISGELIVGEKLNIFVSDGRISFEKTCLALK